MVFFAGYRFWVSSSFLLALEKYCTTFFWLLLFLIRNLSLELFFHYSKVAFLFLCYQIFSFVFFFNYFYSLSPYSSPSRTLITCLLKCHQFLRLVSLKKKIYLLSFVQIVVVCSDWVIVFVLSSRSPILSSVSSLLILNPSLIFRKVLFFTFLISNISIYCFFLCSVSLPKLFHC